MVNSPEKGNYWNQQYHESHKASSLERTWDPDWDYKNPFALNLDDGSVSLLRTPNQQSCLVFSPYDNYYS